MIDGYSKLYLSEFKIVDNIDNSVNNSRYTKYNQDCVHRIEWINQDNNSCYKNQNRE